MGLLSFLKRSPGESSSGRKTSRTAEPGETDRARTRARQRLIGAAVLVGVGVVGFPILFDTQPRPLPVDIPIEIPAKDGAPVLPQPKSRPTGASAVASISRPTPSPAPTSADTESGPANAAREVAATPAPTPLPAPDRTTTTEKPVAAKPAEKTPEKPAESKPAAKEGARAQALLEGRETAAESTSRFVVQVGAFGDANAARDVRQRVEKLGLKTYTQVVETGGGKRIRVRVGPYDDRGEAEKAVAKLKHAGLSPALLTL